MFYLLLIIRHDVNIDEAVVVLHNPSTNASYTALMFRAQNHFVINSTTDLILVDSIFNTQNIHLILVMSVGFRFGVVSKIVSFGKEVRNKS